MTKMNHAASRACGLFAFATALAVSSAVWAEKPGVADPCRTEIGTPCDVGVTRGWQVDGAGMVRRPVKPAPTTVAQRRPEPVAPTRLVAMPVERPMMTAEIAYPRPAPARRPCLSPLCPGSITLGIAY
ncbi:MAG: hypothetical protein OEL76_14435 [Siculibacillus sp.]|nr:hypothetical protein [Siculibacillus sp.]